MHDICYAIRLSHGYWALAGMVLSIRRPAQEPLQEDHSPAASSKAKAITGLNFGDQRTPSHPATSAVTESVATIISIATETMPLRQYVYL